MLRFLTIDAKGRRLVQSGILSDVRITADVRANALVISAPAENLELLEALVRQIDQLPAAEAQIKVFTIVNGDATDLSDMLKTLFSPSRPAPAAGRRLPAAGCSPPSPAPKTRSVPCGSPSTRGPTASSPRARWAT